MNVSNLRPLLRILTVSCAAVLAASGRRGCGDNGLCARAVAAGTASVPAASQSAFPTTPVASAPSRPPAPQSRPTPRSTSAPNRVGGTSEGCDPPFHDISYLILVGNFTEFIAENNNLFFIIMYFLHTLNRVL